MKASDLEIGTKLPHTDPYNIRPHTVVEILYDGAFIKFRTTEGAFRLHHAAPVVFPRRRTGPEVLITAEPRLPEDLAIDDVLPPADPIRAGDPREVDDPYRGERLREALFVYEQKVLERGEYQVVTSITFPRHEFARIDTLTPLGAERRVYMFPISSLVTFPHPTASVAERRDRSVYRTLEAFGPYRNRDTGRAVMFAKHPFGRGRWPQTVPLYSAGAGIPAAADQNTIPEIRPPKSLEDWSRWAYEGPTGRHHPSDRMV